MKKETLTAVTNGIMMVLLTVTFVSMAKDTEAPSKPTGPSYVEMYAAATADVGGECWTGGEGHPLPTEVMVTEKGGSAPVVLTSPTEIGYAIDQVMGKFKVFGHVHQFCAMPKN